MSNERFKPLYEILDNDTHAIIEVLSSYLVEIPERLTEVRSHCKSSQWLEAGKKVHQIKAFYGYSGDEIVVALMNTFEQMLQSEGADQEYNGYLDEIDIRTNGLLAEMKLKLQSLR